MTVQLTFQSTGTVPGSGEPVRMLGPSLSIGRAMTNDLVLPDPERMISKTHCVIENQNGRISVVDLSTNGTFLNYGKVPLGRTPTPLNDGDVLSLGGYELLVSIDEAEAGSSLDLPDPFPEAAPQASSPAQAVLPEDDFLDDILGSKPPTGPSAIDRRDPLDDILPPAPDAPPARPDHRPAISEAFTPPKTSGGLIPDDWDEDLEITRPDNPFAEAPEPSASPAAPPMAGGGEDAAARAFLKALGSDVPVDAADLTETMERLGGVMRVLVAGMREILMTRTSIKGTFRIDQTMISAGGNNPLKFSVSEDQAIDALVKPASKGYQDARAAAAEAIDDIRAHEIAMVSGMDAAVRSLLARLDPAVLADTIEERGGLSGLLKGRKAQYWDVYESLYSEIADRAEADFNELFSREFAQAYKAQLEKLKR